MKQLVTSIGGGIFITVLLYILDGEGLVLSPPNAVAKVLLWPATVCLYLVGPGPRIGPPDKDLHEWTPVHSLALMAGICVLLVFFTCPPLFFFRFLSKHKARTPPSHASKKY